MNDKAGPRRRSWLVATTAWASAWASAWAATGAWVDSARAALPGRWAARPLSTPEALNRIQAGGPSGLLGVGPTGQLWALSTSGKAAQRLAGGLDPSTRIATGHGRLAARGADGSLWVWEDGRASRLASASLAADAGLLVLPLAVVAVVHDGSTDLPGGRQHLVRFEPGPGPTWRATARSTEALLPDARPVLVDLDDLGDGGHIAVLAGPDDRRYRHGVLGDAVEATRVLWLERHGLQALRSFTLAAPHVFEDIELRPVRVPDAPGKMGLLTVRSGPEGGQLALLTADSQQPERLRLAALGDTVGGFHRWLAPTTQGSHLVAVHTPHIGGVLHVYRLADQRLTRRFLMPDVSTHAIGSRETDLAVWLQDGLVLPSQDGRQLLVLDPSADWAERATVALPGRVVMTTAIDEGFGVAVLLADGRVVRAGPEPGPPASGRQR